MLGPISAEWIKYRRTFLRRFLLVAPLFLGLNVVLQLLYAPGLVRSWEQVLQVFGNWWTVLFVPLGSALLAALTEGQERGAGAWRALGVRPVPPGHQFAAKAVVLALHALLGTGVLVAVALAAGAVGATGAVPWRTLLLTACLTWLGSLPVLALHLWAAAAGGAVLTMALGAVGFAAGVWAAPRPSWVLVPWSWPVRMLTPLLGVHPNGVPLPPGDPLFDRSVMTVGAVLGIATFACVIIAASWWFDRREVG